MVDKTVNTMVKRIKGGEGGQTMVDKTDNTMVKRIKGERGETNNGGQDRQHNGQDNNGGGGRQTMVDNTDNTMVKTIMGGDKQWWTIQTTQWSRQ